MKYLEKEAKEIVKVNEQLDAVKKVRKETDRVPALQKRIETVEAENIEKEKVMERVDSYRKKLGKTASKRDINKLGKQIEEVKKSLESFSETKALEKEFQDAMYVIASRLGESRPIEEAFQYVVEFLPNSKAAELIFHKTLA